MNLRHHVFWPPFVLLGVACIMSLVNPEGFLETVTVANNIVLDNFGWAFSLQAFVAFCSCLALFFSPLAEIRIGGDTAKPFLNRWQWFSITICTTVAVGILFWAAAEPLYHFESPTPLSGVAAKSNQAAVSGLSILYLHWSFVPYALYSVPAVVFALAFYNHGQEFSLRSLLFPFPKLQHPIIGDTADILCLYALVLGMAASLGAGILTLNGGINQLFGTVTSNLSIGIICALVVGTFCISASTGLMTGIRILSDINVKVFVIMALFVFLFGNTIFILNYGIESLGQFLRDFFRLVLYTGVSHQDSWPKSWSIFYWANWLAWAPITALFLGRLTYGYTVREVLLFNWVVPSLFSCLWIAIYSGQTLSLVIQDGVQLLEILKTDGPEAIVFQIFESLPLGFLMTLTFVFTAFLSYVTAADSNTEALGQISTKGRMGPESSPSWVIKVAWGVAIGSISWIMVSFSGIDGIKMLSNLGGLVALCLIFTVNIGLFRLMASSHFRVQRGD